MRKTLLLLIPALLTVGCNHEEPAEPLSPQAQEALRTGRTGPPPQANQDPMGGGSASRGADMNKTTGK